MARTIITIFQEMEDNFTDIINLIKHVNPNDDNDSEIKCLIVMVKRMIILFIYKIIEECIHEDDDELKKILNMILDNIFMEVRHTINCSYALPQLTIQMEESTIH